MYQQCTHSYICCVWRRDRWIEVECEIFGWDTYATKWIKYTNQTNRDDWLASGRLVCYTISRISVSLLPLFMFAWWNVVYIRCFAWNGRMGEMGRKGKKGEKKRKSRELNYEYGDFIGPSECISLILIVAMANTKIWKINFKRIV